VSIKNVAELITKAAKFDGDVQWDKGKADGQYKKTADNSKLRRLLPDFEFTPLSKGIKESVDWFERNYLI
jgi:GDP-L-fucose synthase